MSAAIWWIRRDLRIADNPALLAAVASGLPVIPVYLHAPHEEGAWRPGAASNVWLERSLKQLSTELARLGSPLILRASKTAGSSELLRQLINNTGAKAVYWNRLYEPTITTRDTAIKAELKQAGIQAESFSGYLLHEPWQLQTGAGDVYRVFTPYWRNARSKLAEFTPQPAPVKLAGPANPVQSAALAELALRSSDTLRRGWDAAFFTEIDPGEAGAQAAIEQFREGALAHYTLGRDRPDQAGTSRLSAALHFGEVSVTQAAHAMLSSGAPEAEGEFYLRELGWRDFSHQLLYHFPRISDAPLNLKYAEFPWNDDQTDAARTQLRAWKMGQTGIPVIDAGMRELWQTGWMHNRVRMLVASYLTKNLRLHWLHGARWFWNTLVDADLASNTQGWQWAAGCGADAAPYFRIFNPITQGEKFDPRGDYVRRFVPELAKLSGASIHQPWKVGGVRGYPNPIVDLKDTRESALAAFSGWRK